ncbi:MAG: hypothetical protein JXQ75_16010 [Phycisphaerae bacterium]|nr:hypothetical protein [Phycisphaerae bacterium]
MMLFADVLHQRAAQDRLQRAIRTGRVPHAYLFAGPEGVGKEMLATRLAAVLLCASPREVRAPEDLLVETSKRRDVETSKRGNVETSKRRNAETSRRRNVETAGGCDGEGQDCEDQPSSIADVHSSTRDSQFATRDSDSTWLDACGRCDDCVLFAAGNHPDFHRIHRTLNKFHPDSNVQKRKALQLSVDVIRHFLIDKVGLHPARGRAKVFIIAEADRLSGGAQNAMLKTLEEPPGHSYLILLATSADALLATTRSRCQHVAFRALPAQFITRQLTEHHGAPAKTAQFLAELSQGSLGMAIRLAELDFHDKLPVILKALQTGPDDPLKCGKTLLDSAKAMASGLREEAGDGEDTHAARRAQAIILATVAMIMRDVLRLAVGHTPAALPTDPAVAALARTTTPDAIGRTIRAVSAAEYQIDRSANTSLVFDAVGIELARGLAGGS